jgi:endonuclease/exonuclease/phosphatase family metal-dependent hydrolase
VPFRTRLVLPWPLPPLRRALHGYLGPRTVLIDELPPERRPSALALHSRAKGLTPVEGELTVLSYNVQRGHRLERAVTTIREAVDLRQPDLIFLQEAPVELLDHPRLEHLLAPRTLLFAPFHQVDRPDRFYSSRQYGQLIASAVGLESPRVVELPTVNPSTLRRGHLMKRIALCGTLRTRDRQTIEVVNVHNEPFARRSVRLIQFEALLEAADHRSPDIAILCGDFNPSLSLRGEPGHRLLESAGFENAFAHRWRTLDTCLARGHSQFLSAESLRLPGSDHRPIVVRVAVGEC